MNKKLAVILLCIFIVLLSGCTTNDIKYENDNLVLFGTKYEVSDSSWHPFGDAVSNNGYDTYKNDKSNIFINVKDKMSDILYHKIGDEYPSIVQKDKVEKIELAFENRTVTVDDNCKNEIIKLCSTNTKQTDLKRADLSSEFVFVNVYYCDYPAYQNEFLICRTYDGEFALMYCDSQENADAFGSNTALVINSAKLINFLNENY